MKNRGSIFSDDPTKNDKKPTIMTRRVPLPPVSPEGYPFYALPVSELLKMADWSPHQKLLPKLLNLTENPSAAAGREVIFVSHQWLGFTHPDPLRAQLVVLLRVLKKLLSGALDVRTNAELEAIYSIKVITEGAEWKQLLSNALLWIDYTSIPQPSAADDDDDDKEAKEALPLRVSRRNSDHRLTPAGGGGGGGGGAEKARLVEQLVAAVDSIPSYIERCTQMWVLVPPSSHADLPGATCDFFSWRQRGWCRMEFAASKLARGDDMPLMVIESEETVYYLNPCDSAKMSAARGEFTVPDDAHKVNSILAKMLDAKVAFFFEQGDPTLAR